MDQIIKEALEVFGLTPYEINTGNCDGFADLLLAKAEELGLDVKLIVNDSIGHVWVKYRGKHYDAETSIGVTNWKELPAFNRSKIKGVTDDGTANDPGV